MTDETKMAQPNQSGENNKAPLPAPPIVDETFDFVDFEQEPPQRFGLLFWLQWIILLSAGFAMLSVLSGGFDHMAQYGWSPTGVNYAVLLSKTEKIFGLGLLAMLPVTFFLVLAFERRLARPLEVVSRWVYAPGRIRYLLPTLIFICAGLIVATAYLVLDNTPITDDENVYLFQTRILSHSRLTLPSLPDAGQPSDRLFEDNIFMVNNGKIFGQYPFGQSIMLWPGVLLGWPRLTSLLWALLTIWGIFLLARELYGPRLAFVASLLTAASPMFLSTSATLLSHSTELCSLVWFFYFSYRTWREDKLWLPVLAGLAFFVAFQVRSATALLAGGPIGLALAVVLLRDFRRHWAKIAILTVFVALALGTSFTFNEIVNGSIFKTNYHAAWGEGRTPFRHPFGFGKGAWHMMHTPRLGLHNMFNNVTRLNWWLFGWPISLIFVAAWLLRKDKKPFEWIAFSTVVLTFVAYFFYFWPGVADTGPVLYYELMGVLILLSVSGIEAASRLLLRWMPRTAAQRRVTLFVIFSCLIAFATFHQVHTRVLMDTVNHVQELDRLIKRYDIPRHSVVFTNYYLKGAKDYNFQDSWVVGRPPTSRLLGDKRLFYANYGRVADQKFLAKYHPGVPAWVITWSPQDVPEVVKLDDYTVDVLTDNLPDSR